MKDLKHLQYFENLIQIAGNELVQKEKEEGKVCVACTCENVPEPLLNLPGTFGVRLYAPNTGSMDIATYYMTSFLCETSRAILERAIEGGFNYADCIIAPDGCTMMNRCVENMELVQALGAGKEHFFYEHMEIPLKADETGTALLKVQCENHILKPLHTHYGIDTSDAAIRKAIEEHNEVCRIIREMGDFRKDEHPRITGYEFAVLVLATYVCPKNRILPYLYETLEELRTREPDIRKKRVRLLVVGSEVDDPSVISLMEECGAFVCCDRYCFGSRPGRDLISLNDDEDALTQLCRHYTMKTQCPRQFNMDKVYGRKQVVNDLALEYHADGIVYNQIKFCDPWNYERVLGAEMLREDYGFPVLSLDRPYNISSASGQTRTRIQAFIESIEMKKLKEGRS